MPDSFWDHPIETLEKALHLRKQIESLKKSLGDLMGGELPAALSTSSKKDRRKGKRSAAARARMAAAQKARWAKKRGESAAPVINGAKKKKRTMSPEARARIAAAQRARWAKRKG